LTIIGLDRFYVKKLFKTVKIRRTFIVFGLLALVFVFFISGKDKAISMFNAYQLGERPLTVNMAKPRVERSGGSYRGF